MVLKQQELSICGGQVAYTVDSITDMPTEQLSIYFLHVNVINPSEISATRLFCKWVAAE